ncbi:MAG: winged helix-turn-helix domain-containing protein [Betaproteobacteria bacterium]|nr:winged helix-turn-helix domain-containing protein [Betaproteobacteria bacterium]
MGARAFDLLLALIERRDRLVTKNELLELVWPGLVVEENNLQVQVSALRKLLGPDAIATVAGRGYRFTLEPTQGVGPAVPPSRTAQGNLPAPVSSFIGRERELTDLRAC